MNSKEMAKMLEVADSIVEEIKNGVADADGEPIYKCLEDARKKYGNRNQIMVAMEELCELSCALAKFPRYDDEEKAIEETREKVLDEVADVYIVLEHVKSIFQLRPEEILSRELKKLNRLERWLKEGDTMQQTIDDREV